MAVVKGSISLLCELSRKIDLNGSVLQLGKQDSYVSKRQLKKIFRKFQIEINVEIPEINSFVPFDFILSLLGFEKVESLDFSDFEGAEIIQDLNLPIPEKLKNRYDLIFDGGTAEHVFHIPQCLKNINDMLTTKGLVFHLSPSTNHVDHGFYMFSPTLFYDYYSANNFNILMSYIFEYGSDHSITPWYVYDYVPGAIDKLSFGGWGRKQLGICFVAQKLEETAHVIIPMQGSYRKQWESKNSKLYSSNKLEDYIKKYCKENIYIKFLIKKIYVFLFIRILKLHKPKLLSKY